VIRRLEKIESVLIVHVAAIVAACYYLPDIWSSSAEILEFGWFPALGAILATVVVFWGRGVPWRLAALTVTFVVAMVVCHGQEQLRFVFILLLTLCSLFAATPALVLMRFLGVTLRWRDKAEASGPDPTRLSPCQFSLRAMMAWVGAIAIILGTLSYAPRPNQNFQSPVSLVILCTAVFAPLVLSTLLPILWLTLGRGRLMLRLAAFVGGCVLGPSVWHAVAALSGETIDLPVPSVFTVSILWQVATFFRLRLAGLELVRQRAVAVDDLPSKPPVSDASDVVLVEISSVGRSN